MMKINLYLATVFLDFFIINIFSAFLFCIDNKLMNLLELLLKSIPPGPVRVQDGFC